MATDSFHRVIIKKNRHHHVFSNVFDRILFILAGNYDMNENLEEFHIWPDLTTEVAALECMKKYPLYL